MIVTFPSKLFTDIPLPCIIDSIALTAPGTLTTTFPDESDEVITPVPVNLNSDTLSVTRKLPPYTSIPDNTGTAHLPSPL